MLWIAVIGSLIIGFITLVGLIFDLFDCDWKSALHSGICLIICVVIFFVSTFCLAAILAQSYQETEKLLNMNLYHYRIIAKYLVLPVVGYFMYMLLWILMKFICIITSLVMDTGKAKLLLKM